MPHQRWFQNLTRLWRMIILPATLYLSLLSLDAGAAKVPDKAQVATTGDVAYIDMTARISTAQTRNADLSIFGRSDEAGFLEERLGLSESNTVLVTQGETSDTRTAVIDAFIRTRPQTKVYRLNTNRFSQSTPSAAALSLKQIIATLEKQPQTALYIDAVSAAPSALPTHVLQALIEQALREKGGLLKIIEADPQIVSDTVARNASVEVLNVLPMDYDRLLGQLKKDRAAMESAEMKFTTGALEEAARISVRYRRVSSLRFARQLLHAALKMSLADFRAGSQLRDRISADLKQLEAEREALAEAGRPNLRLEEIDSKLSKKMAELAALDAPADTWLILTELNLKHALHTRSTERRTDTNRNLWQRLKNRITGNEDAASAGRANDFKLPGLGEQIDEAVAEIRQTEDSESKPATQVGVRQVLAVASQWLKIPASRLSIRFNEGVRRFHHEAKSAVPGQESVIDAIQARLSVSSLHGMAAASNRPAGSLWLNGARGSGQAAIVVALARSLRYPLIRHDLSDRAGNSLLGDLPAKIEKNPAAIVLLEESERASPRAWDALLQILDTGRLSLAADRFVDFRKTVVILTGSTLVEYANHVDGIIQTAPVPQTIAATTAQRTAHRLSKLSRQVYLTDLNFSSQAADALAAYLGEDEISRSMLQTFDELLSAGLPRLLLEHRGVENSVILVNPGPNRTLEFVTLTPQSANQ